MAKSNQIHFTKKTLAELPLPEPGKRTYYYDDKVDGLQIAVTQKGTKTFYLYRKIQGKPERIKLGHFPHMTPEGARKAAQVELAKITMGRNPKAEKRAAAARTVTLRTAFESYLTVRNLKPKTTYDYRRIMEVAFPDWLDKQVVNIRKDTVTQRHQQLGTERGQAYANLSMRVLRAVFNFARYQYEDDNGEALLPDNPVERLSQTRVWYPIRRRETVIQAHDLARWYKAVMQLKTAGPPSSAWHVADYLLLQLFTGLRRQEGAKLQWANVDLVGRTLTVPDTKNHNDHTLPLSDFLHELLTERQRHVNDNYVFPGGGAQGHLVEPRNQIARVVKDSDVAFTLHDLRRTFLTVAESLDIPAYALKRLANHTVNGDVTAAYIRMSVDRLRKPMQAITDALLYHAGVRENPPAEGLNSKGGLA